MEPPPRLTLQIKSVTPEMAEALLETNAVNRPVSFARVQRLAEDMRAGNWRINGETIIVSTTGKLMDGQHRLYAVREYGHPVDLIFAEGADESAFETIDTGRSRQTSDIAAMRGVDYPVLSAACASLVWKLWFGANPTEPCPPATVLRVLDRYSEIQKWVPMVDRLGNKRTAPGAAFATSLVYLAGIARAPMLADRLFYGLAEGAGLASGDPVLTLRNRLLSMRVGGQVMNTMTCWALIVRTIDALERGEQLFKVVNEPMRGPIKRPALWASHLPSLPRTKNLDDLPHPALLTVTKNKRTVFADMVKEHKAAAIERPLSVEQEAP